MSRLRIAMCVAAAALCFAAPLRATAQTATPPAETKPDAPAPPPAAAPFAEEIMMTARTIVFRKGTANWDSAFETLLEAFKSLKLFLDQHKLTAAGPLMTIYVEADDTGFQYQAAVPIAAEPASKPRGDIAVGKSPEGKALRFVHRGTYDSLDNTYEAITDYLDEKRLESQDMFIEEYVTDPITTAEDKLVIHVLVPLK